MEPGMTEKRSGLAMIWSDRYATRTLPAVDTSRLKIGKESGDAELGDRCRGRIELACIAPASFTRGSEGPSAKVLKNAQHISSSSDHTDLIIPVGGTDSGRNRKTSQSTCYFESQDDAENERYGLSVHSKEPMDRVLHDI